MISAAQRITATRGREMGQTGMGANVESTLHEDGARKTTSRRFAPWHAADAIFFPALLAFLWLGILAGFVPEIVDHIVKRKPPYLWIVHVHAVFFVGWLVLLTMQMSLVRARNLGLHRHLGRMASTCCRLCWYWALSRP